MSEDHRDRDQLLALRKHDLLDVPAEEAFDRLTRMARAFLGVQAAFISLADEGRDFYLSHCGFGEPLASTRQLTGETFCHYAMVSVGPLVIDDTRAHPVYRDVPPVASLEVAAYVGVPLRTSTGEVLGAFCVIDTKPRHWEEREIQILEELAASTLTEIELRRTAAAAALAQSAAVLAEERFVDLVHGLDAIVWEMDAQTWRFTFVSRAAEELLGYPVERWLQEVEFWSRRLLHPDDREWATRFCMSAADAARDHEFEYRAIASDGRVVWLHDRVRVVTDEAGRPRLLRGVMVDVSEQKQAAHELTESEEKFRQIAENVREIFWIFDPDFTHTIYVSPAYEEIWGRSLESVYRNPRSFVEPVHPQDVDALVSAMGQVKERVLKEIEYRILRPDGSVRWVVSRGFPVRDSHGEVYRVVGTTVDITARKAVEAERTAAEARYRRLVETSPYAIFALDLEGRFTELNPAAAHLLERSPEELIGHHMAEVIAPDDMDDVTHQRHDRLVTGRDVIDHEVRIVRASGEIRLAHVRSTVIRESGVVIGTHGIVRDITEERARQEEVRLLATALQSLEEGVSISRLDGQIIYANAAHGRLLGYDPERRPLPNIRDFAVDDDAEDQLQEAVRAAAEHGIWTGRLGGRRVDDRTVVPLELILGRVDRSNDRSDGESLLFTITRDITEDVEQEKRLRRAERLASVGTLLGGVAHELNNPLHAIINFTQLLLLEPHSEQEREDLETVEHEAKRMAKIVADLRLIARRTQDEPSERTPVDLNDIVLHILKTRQYAQMTRNIAVKEDLAPDLPPIVADQGQLEQVVLNLIVNAEQAMAGERGERRLILRTRATPTGVSLHVVDSGPGIPQSVLERIFDPFFTTKAPGEGTGLGLSLVHSIVSEHGGDIRVDSQVGKGAAFRVELPRAREERGAFEADAVEAAPSEPLRVLVVDDEAAVRRAIVRFLGRRGHAVVQAAEGSEALRVLDETDASNGFDVILSDLRMPGLDGEDFMERLREHGGGYERRVVFLTGDAASPDAARLIAATNAPVLLKPISLTEVAFVLERHAAETRDR